MIVVELRREDWEEVLEALTIVAELSKYQATGTLARPIDEITEALAVYS